jgi:hypothetical protein
MSIESSGGNWSPPSGEAKGEAAGGEAPPGPFIGLAMPKLGRPPDPPDPFDPLRRPKALIAP